MLKDAGPPLQAYYGEYPLSFAAATGQKDMALLLYRHGASPYDHDAQGNTALHISVFHGQKEMYDFLGRSLTGAEDRPSATC